MTSPKEFDIKGTFTIGFIVWVAAVCFSIGVIISRVLGQSEDIKSAREYTTQEVDGLRADWERDRKEQERRLENLEEKHTKE